MVGKKEKSNLILTILSLRLIDHIIYLIKMNEETLQHGNNHKPYTNSRIESALIRA